MVLIVSPSSDHCGLVISLPGAAAASHQRQGRALTDSPYSRALVRERQSRDDGLDLSTHRDTIAWRGGVRAQTSQVATFPMLDVVVLRYFTLEAPPHVNIQLEKASGPGPAER